MVRVRLGLGERRAVEGDATVTHDDRPVDERLHRAELVRDQDDGGAARLEDAQRVRQGLLVRHVDAGSRLVEDEEVGLAGQGAGDQHALLLAAAELGDADGRALARGRRRRWRRRSPRRSARVSGRKQPAPGDSAGGHDLPHRRRYAAARAGSLRDEADAVPVAEVGVRGAEERHRPRGQRQQAGHGPDQGGLAGPVGAQQREELARTHGQVDPAQDRPAADGDRRVLHLHGVHEHPFAFRSAARFSRMSER